MTKSEAFLAMIKGQKVKHEYYSDNEYLFINKDGVFETEDGYTHGYINDELWVVHQNWETGWSLYIPK